MNHTNHPHNTNEEQPQQTPNNTARIKANNRETTKNNTDMKTTNG
jgi:hypothetical protein